MRSTLLMLFATLAAGAVTAATPGGSLAPFTASYTVTWHGMAAGTSQLQLERLDDGSWRYGSRNRPRGLFRLALPPELAQQTRFDIRDGAVRPLQFDADDGSGNTGGKRNASVRFDWELGRATGHSGGTGVDLPLAPGLQDTMSIQVSLMQALLQGRMPTRFQVLDDNRIKEYVYEHEGTEQVETRLGTQQAVVFRSLRPGSTRSTWFWCAPGLAYLPVKVERRNGSKVEWSMSLLEAQVG